MVNPIYILIIILGSAFLLPLIDRIKRGAAMAVFYAALGAVVAISLQPIWEPGFIQIFNNIFTAGFRPPFSINLRYGEIEAFLLIIINIGSLLGSIYLSRKLISEKIYALMLILTLSLGVNGLVMTRDIFNIFVFLEITSISLYALIGLKQTRQSLEAGFKYIIASGLASALLLIGIIYAYRITGVLNLDMIETSGLLLLTRGGMTALFLITISFLIELKPFPANGWALDVYQAAEPGVSALVAGIVAAGMIAVFYKLMPLLTINWQNVFIVLGVITYLFSNLTGIKQKNARRMLGYSSIAQMGLLTSVVTYSLRLYPAVGLNSFLFNVGGALFINHFLAKAGLYWLAGLVGKESWQEWSFKSKPFVAIFFAVFVFALIGLPPFPGFWAKITLFSTLSQQGLYWWLVPIILGSLLEAVYLLRWFGSAVKSEAESAIEFDLTSFFPIFLAAFGLIFVYPIFVPIQNGLNFIFLLPLAVAALFWAMNILPSRVKGILLIVFTATAGWYIYPAVHGITQIFEFIFVFGGIVITIASLHDNTRREGFYAFLGMLIYSLILIPLAHNSIEFFLVWEFMTISSWLLVMRGKNGEKPALRYIIFSLAAALLILAGLALSYGETGSWELAKLANLQTFAIPVYILLALGFLIKAAGLGLHIWLPGAYAESEHEITPIFSGMMSKISVWAFIMLTGYLGATATGSVQLSAILGWTGVLTAFFGALMAVFQEDIKYLLAYSSMSQLGYMILSVAMLSHLGWTTALYLSVTHLFFKGMLFIAVAGIVSRIGTTKMYEMGGLIKRMPLSFISVLMAIIAVSGVPPLSGFGGKWLLYTALLEKGWYLQAGLSFFAGAIAFLYLFRLIHTIFLGQLKPQFRQIKEASLWYIIPQFIFVGAVMAVSMFPNIILKPIMSAVGTVFESNVNWEGYKVISTLGYWNGNAVMMITMGVFIVPLIWLLTRVKMVQKVEQFNIVYAAERPDKPETTHYAYNFFAPYQKALGFLVSQQVTRFWQSVAEWFHTLSSALRHIYTGNAQTYALHIIIYIVIIYTFLGVK